MGKYRMCLHHGMRRNLLNNNQSVQPLCQPIMKKLQEIKFRCSFCLQRGEPERWYSPIELRVHLVQQCSAFSEFQPLLGLEENKNES